jgi:kynurenine formamidase
VVLLLSAAAPAAAQPFDPAAVEVVDLSHGFGPDTVYWPSAPPAGFELRELARGRTAGGWFYAANAFATPEHGGTHLDAPIHFAENGQPVERIPASRLVVRAVVIDVAAAAGEATELALSAADVRAFEARHGRIPAGSLVLLRTGWDRFWPDRRAYLGDDTPGDASKLRFPSFGASAARVLVEERGVAGLGVDTASIDVGSSRDFPVHRIAAARDVYGLENLTGLGGLPPVGAVVVALPMKIEGGSGAPLRAIALIEKNR